MQSFKTYYVETLNGVIHLLRTGRRTACNMLTTDDINRADAHYGRLLGLGVGGITLRWQDGPPSPVSPQFTLVAGYITLPAIIPSCLACLADAG